MLSAVRRTLADVTTDLTLWISPIMEAPGLIESGGTANSVLDCGGKMAAFLVPLPTNVAKKLIAPSPPAPCYSRRRPLGELFVCHLPASSDYTSMEASPFSSADSFGK